MSTAVFFAFAGTRRRMYAGPLGPHIDDFITWLQEQHYTRHSIRCKIRVVADFSSWLTKRHLGASAADAERVQRFLKCRERTDSATTGDLSALRQIADILLRKQVTQPSAVSLNERERVEQAFCTYLLQNRGLQASTPICYVRHVSRFLRGQFGGRPVRFNELVGADITGFIQRDTLGRNYSRAQQTLTAMYAFLRYLHVRGLIATDLAACVPKAAHWSLAKLPSFLRPTEVTRILALCERRSALGRRNYAMLLLLARLGLRAGEVAALTLDHIDWQGGVLTIRGKGGQWAQMPLPQDVGEAIADYLEHGRPLSSDRHVFVSVHAPRRGLRGATSISVIASRALARARIKHPRAAAHIFRHALATEMLQQGASLSEIGRLLRHRHPDTARIYAKVHLTALRDLAMPWPGGAR
ncbi:MAG: tyrosine-type recombinase/integrase [Steroidobacteraceae bacterium]